MHDTFDPILNEEQYTALVGISRPTAQRQRSDGSGPPFVQLSERRIGYRQSAVEQWLEGRTINRVGELVCSKQAPDPTAQATATTTVAPEAIKASTQAAPTSRPRTRGARSPISAAEVGQRAG
jgi:predicted DNA-binding transcriptional regulator AlpA